MKQLLITCIILFLSSILSIAGIHRPPNLTPPPWAEWTLHHIIYENESTQDKTISYLEEYLDHNLPVGMIIVDAPWEDYYNTFDWDTGLYSDPQTMVDRIHQLGSKVLVWITPNINDDAPIYDYAKNNGYLLNNGQTAKWWHGQGAYIDYTNPAAVEWWHSLMDKVLDLGIDGWKCDGSDPMVVLLGVAIGQGGVILPWEYSDMYYRDFLSYTRKRNGRDKIILSRPVDSYEGLAYYPFTPRDVLVAGWTGDHDPTWHGLRHGLLNMLASGELNYVNFGSEIGGFRSGDSTRTKELMVRWAQMSAFSPIYINGGNGEHRPWMYDQETMRIYTECTHIHYRLIPYLYSQGAEAWHNGTALLKRTGQNNFAYTLGDALFVAPITESAANIPTRQVVFPAGQWIDWYTGAIVNGPGMLTLRFNLDKFPAYIRKGAIIPMYHDFNNAEPGDPLEVFIYYPEGHHEFKLYEENGPGFIINYTRSRNLKINVTGTQRAIDYKIYLWTAPTRVTARNKELPRPVNTQIRPPQFREWSWNYDATQRLLTIHGLKVKNGVEITVEF